MTRFSIILFFCFCMIPRVFAQYCIPSQYYMGCSQGDNIASFSTTGGSRNITNINSGCNSGIVGYSYFSNLTHRAFQGQDVNWFITNGTHNSERYNIWVDFNMDGDFSDEGEEVYFDAPYVDDNEVVSGSFHILSNSLTGTTRIRIRNNRSGSDIGPCDPTTYGEIEDYNLEILPALPCSGTPVAGAAYGPGLVCPNARFQIVDTGFSTSGILNYQWEFSPSGSGVWTVLTGATTASYFISQGINVPTDFRLVVSCPSTAMTATSNVFTVAVKAPYICYCGPEMNVELLNYLGPYNALSQVSIPGTGFSNTTTANTRYTLFYPVSPSTTAVLSQGMQYTINTSQQAGYRPGVWIDYNHDQIFSAAEYIAVTVSGTSGAAVFTVPVNAITGPTGLRVIPFNQPTINPSLSCANHGSDIEDYVVTIASAAPCAGTPVTGIAFAPNTVCPDKTFLLSDTGYTAPTATGFQWESSPSGQNNWMAIPAANTPCHLLTGGINIPTDFRLVVSCPGTGTSAVSNAFTVTLNSVPVPAVTASGSFMMCPNSKLEMDASGGNSYMWTGNQPYHKITVSLPGIYTVVVTNSYGCSASLSKEVTVNPIPTTVKIATSGAAIVCAPNSVPLYIDLSAGTTTGYDHQWKLNGSAISGATSTNYTATTTGNYTLTISGGGCSRTSNFKAIKIKSPPVALASASGNTTFCEGGAVMLSASANTGYTYKWYRNSTSVGTASSYKAATAGSYTMVAKLNGCLDTAAPIMVSVNPLPAASVHSSDPLTFCIGGSATLQASPVGSGYTYQWYKGTNSLSGATMSSYLSSVTGSYKVQVTDNNGCTKLSSGVTTTQKPLPTATITALGPTSFPTGGDVVLRASNGTGYTWKWYKNGTIISGATTRDYVATAAGDYTVKVTKGSCSAISAIKTVSTTSPKAPSSNSAVAEDGFQLVAYPNPVNRELTIGVKGMDQVKGVLQLLDVNGKLIMSKEMNGVTETIDMSSFTPGVYLLRYSDGIHRESLTVVKQ